MSFVHAIREKHGLRCFFYAGSHNRTIKTELYWWSSVCDITLGVDDEGWYFNVALPPLALYLRLSGFGLWHPTYTTTFDWEDPPRDVTLPDRREFSLSVHDWAVWLTPWGRWGEWRARDPWWIRGVSFHIDDFVLGRASCTCEKGTPFGVTIPMPEGLYNAIATPERRTWKRPRWFKRVRDGVWLDIPNGIPHAGKGENSWDCGDDGLFGIGGDTLTDAIQNARESVTRARQKYGPASDEAMRLAETDGDASPGGEAKPVGVPSAQGEGSGTVRDKGSDPA